jgi:hypothetical protein
MLVSARLLAASRDAITVKSPPTTPTASEIPARATSLIGQLWIPAQLFTCAYALIE